GPWPDCRALGRRGLAGSARGDTQMTGGIGLYVHIPFCASRYPYCDFETAPARTTLRVAYLEALREEIAREGRALGRPRIRTLYVGGGTPSLLDPSEIELLAGALREAFDVRPREATIEVNPATLDRVRLDAWLALGVARLYRLAEGVLARSGYRHYEIANWARPRKRSLHNLGYWRDRDWLGVGAGAHTHLGGVRSANPVELRTYIAHARSGSARSADLESDPRAEAAMLALRLDTGLDLRRY